MMKCLVVLPTILLLANAVPAMKWFEVQPALDAKDARLQESHVNEHWETFKHTHCMQLVSLFSLYVKDIGLPSYNNCTSDLN